eukprot:3562022-Pleurochrysis_carterae.AAC.1
MYIDARPAADDLSGAPPRALRPAPLAPSHRPIPSQPLDRGASASTSRFGTCARSRSSACTPRMYPWHVLLTVPYGYVAGTSLAPLFRRVLARVLHSAHAQAYGHARSTALPACRIVVLVASIIGPHQPRTSLQVPPLLQENLCTVRHIPTAT